MSDRCGCYTFARLDDRTVTATRRCINPDGHDGPHCIVGPVAKGKP